ncbi:rhodanese-like domain-containing protein [Pelistega europaea]|uniref:Sulfurtransferase n=1 Tax=Pelistega europaea TaxID=106147 RepID=A0A7Y4LA11_9BURK|nr:rhodanese-like domain-containing protein [Pelistega europaea]NOL49683.1 sulfurtransferase [Pelistega europaea]
MIQQITVQTLKQWLDEGRDITLLDVREDNEVAFANIPGHLHIPMHLIPIRHAEIDDSKPLVIYCHHGMRSLQTGLYLTEVGFEDVYNVQGGIDAWSTEIDTSVPRY